MLLSGCSLRAISSTVLLLLLLSLPAFAGDANASTAAAGEEEPDAVNSASITPRVGGALLGSNATTAAAAAAEGGVVAAPEPTVTVGNNPKVVDNDTDAAKKDAEAPGDSPKKLDKKPPSFSLPRSWYSAW